MLKIDRLKTTSSKLGLLLIAVIAVTIIVSKLFFRIDLTEEKAYTLSAGSLNIAKNLDSNVIAKLYFSKSIKQLPVQISTYGTRVEEVLREYAAYSGGKLAIDVIDPKPDTDDEVWARNYGIDGVPVSESEELFLGVVFIAGDREVVIPYLDPRKEEFLEYDLSEAIVKLQTKVKPKLGLFSSFNMEGAEMGSPQQAEGGAWAILDALRNFYDVRTLEGDASEIPSDIDILLVVHPKNISEAMQYALDQFVLRDGRLIVAVDPYSRIDRAMSGDNSAAMMGGNMPQASSDLPKLFAAWGVEFSANEVVGDPLAATRVSGGGVDVIDYPLFMNISSNNFSSTSKVTAHLKQMMYTEGGFFKLKEGSSYTLDPLIETSENSGTLNAFLLNFQPPSQLANAFNTDGTKRILAGFIKGKFKSAFAEKPQGVNDNITHRAEADKEGVVLVIGDVDFLHDSNSVQKFRFGPQVIVQPRNDNLNFIVNAVEFFSGSQDLISIRSSGKVTRSFTKVLELQIEAGKRWKAEEERLSAELEGLQQTLSALQAERTDGNRTALTTGQMNEISRFKDQEKEIRNKRRIVRKNLREDIETLGHVLIAANLAIMPIMVIVFGVLVFWQREKRARREKTNA